MQQIRSGLKKRFGHYRKLTIELKNLVIPEKPVNIDEPVLPRKPALRRMPVLTFEEKVGKKEVREVFFSEWNK